MSNTTDTKPDAGAKRGADMVTINIPLLNDGEPNHTFIGWNGRDFLLERGKDVRVPRGILGVLDDAVTGVPSQHPEKPNEVIITMRKRFPYTVVSQG